MKFFRIGYHKDHFALLSDIHLSPLDLGIQRGYGVFDFFAFSLDQNPWVDLYLDRLYRSLDSVGMDITLTREDLLLIAEELLIRNEVNEAFIKILVTAGPSDDGYTRKGKGEVLLLGMPITRPQPSLYELGGKLITADYSRDMPDVTTTNYMYSAMLAPSMRAKNALDVLYHDRGLITEASRCNCFIVKEGEILTPEKSVLKGITRHKVLHMDSPPLPVRTSPIYLEDVKKASEAFITSTTKGIMPIVSIDDHIIGTGHVGSVCTKLIRSINTWLG